MKKKDERIAELERRVWANEILDGIVFTYGILVLLPVLIFLNLPHKDKIDSIYQILFCIVLAALLPFFFRIATMFNKNFIEQVKEHMTKRMEMEENIEEIKKIAKDNEGCITEFVTIQDEDFIRDILSRSIFEIEIDRVENSNIVIKIRLDDDTVTSPSSINIKKLDFVSVLNEDLKKEILEYAITNIKLTNLEQEEKTIEISGPGYLWTNYKATDEEIIEIFKLNK